MNNTNKISYWIAPVTERFSKGQMVDKLITRVCKHFNISPDELKIKTKRHAVTEPKHIIYYILREEYDYSLNEAGALFDNDHSNVSYSVKKIKGFIDVDQDYKELVNGLIN